MPKRMPYLRMYLRKAVRDAWDSRSIPGTLASLAAVVVASLFLYLGSAHAQRGGVVLGMTTTVAATVLVVVAVFLWHLSRAPGRLHFDQAQEITRLRGELDKPQPSFPDLEIEVRESGWFPLETEAQIDRRAILLKLRITNRDDERVNLTFDAHTVWVTRLPDMEPLVSRLYQLRETQNRKYEENLLPSVTEVDPKRTIPKSADGGFLVFEVWGNHEINFHHDGSSDGGSYEVKKDHKIVLSVHDYVSNKTIEIGVPDTWSR